YSVLNWDLLGVCLMVAALLLFVRGRELAGGAVLGLATAAKFFPIVVLPVVLALEAAERRWRAAGGIAGAFVAGTVFVNPPFAVDLAPGRIRASWLYFFRLTDERPPR